MRGMKVLPGIVLAAVTFLSAESLLILPITGDVGKAEDMATVNQLYRDVVEGKFKGTVLPAPIASEPCGARDCAVKVAQTSQANQVIYSTFSRLGTKWVFSSTIVKSDGSDAFNQRLTALSIEDMEPVTQRMADALLNRKGAEQVATVDNLTEKEQTQQPQRRRSLYSTGLRVGYLYPAGKSFSYLDDHHTCTYFCFETDSITYTTQSFNQVIRLAWMNNWQFRNDLLLNTDIEWGLGKPYVDLGVDANLDYVFNRGDYSPFAGGGLGIHYVHNDEDPEIGDRKNNSGLTLTAQGGLIMFRTYDVNLVLRGYYQVILNSDLDNGAGFDVGVTYRRSEAAKRGSSNGSFWSTVGKICAIGCAGYLVLIGAVLLATTNN